MNTRPSYLKLTATLALLAVVLFARNSLLAEEVSLFDHEGSATAYIAEDLTIYLWSGEPVAYLYPQSNSVHIYGFNGHHLGWMADGIIIDHDGNAVGSVRGALQMFYQFEPFKSFKQFKPFKSFREFAPFAPFRSNRWSRVPLRLFLAAGAE